MTDDGLSELRTVLAAYDLGELDRSVRDRRGTVNTSFFIDTLKGGQRRRFFLRRYKPSIQREEIRFEHALINHVADKGHCPVARPHPTRDGHTVLERGGAYYAIFDYLPGEDRYTWVGPRCSSSELRAAGRLLAQFHSDVATFRAPGRRAEPRTLRLLTVIGRAWERARRRPPTDAYLAYAHEHAGDVRASLAKTSDVLRRVAADLPKVIIHSDFHPGNLKFEGATISGLVDFDWAKTDVRLFDVALAVWYFCASWEGRADGRLRLPEVGAFLGAYQQRLAEPADLPPLSHTELEVFPEMINAGSLYVLYWGLSDYLSKPVDPAEYLIYLRHSVATSRWLSRPKNRRRLMQVVRRAARPESGRGRAGRSHRD